MDYDITQSGVRSGAGEYRCVYCNDTIAINESEKVPFCRSCGGDKFYVLDLRSPSYI